MTQMPCGVLYRTDVLLVRGYSLFARCLAKKQVFYLGIKKTDFSVTFFICHFFLPRYAIGITRCMLKRKNMLFCHYVKKNIDKHYKSRIRILELSSLMVCWRVWSFCQISLNAPLSVILKFSEPKRLTRSKTKCTVMRFTSRAG